MLEILSGLNLSCVIVLAEWKMATLSERQIRTLCPEKKIITKVVITENYIFVLRKYLIIISDKFFFFICTLNHMHLVLDVKHCLFCFGFAIISLRLQSSLISWMTAKESFASLFIVPDRCKIFVCVTLMKI